MSYGSLKLSNVSFSGNKYLTGDNSENRRDPVAGAAAATGGIGATCSATRGSSFKMFANSKKVTSAINNVVDGANVAAKPISQTSSVWNAMKLNYHKFTGEIGKWAESSNMPKFVKSMFKGKLASVFGGAAAVFVFVSGIVDIWKTFGDKINPNA